MKNNKAIEELFARYQPDLGDREQYMKQISKKLEAAEYAKKYGLEQTRRYRRMMIAVFVAGTLTGAVSVVLFLLHPLWLFPVQNVSGSFLTTTMTWLPKLFFLLAACVGSLCITGLVIQLAEHSRLKFGAER